MTLSYFACRVGIGRAAVVNWRRQHDDFPAAVEGAGTEESPLFDREEADAWLLAHGKISNEPRTVPPPPAVIDFGEGCTVEMQLPSLDPYGRGYMLGGYVDQEWEPRCWPHADFTTDLAGERLTVEQAHVDLKGYGIGTWRYLRLTWRPRPQPTAPAPRRDRAEDEAADFYTDADDEPRTPPRYPRTDPYAAPADGEASLYDGRTHGPALDW
ncbi:hypothetical protein [Streptomyces tsukubensis]|uniref:hypothetical protein n=1 Tax=Streptomyces tsukubensis TaxID=83656 RepID=UPI00344FA0A3